MKKIKQETYRDIEIDPREKDIVILWAVDPKGKDSQIIQIERANLHRVINALTLELANQMQRK